MLKEMDIAAMVSKLEKTSKVGFICMYPQPEMV